MITAKDILTWIELNPKKYYKDGRLYGLIGTKEGADGVLYLACMAETIDSKFTNSMIKDIITMCRNRVICLIVDTESKKEVLARSLKRYIVDIKYNDNLMYVFVNSSKRRDNV